MRPSGWPSRPTKRRQTSGNRTSAPTAVATSAICDSTRVWIAPGTICLVAIALSQVPDIEPCRFAPARSAPRSGAGMIPARNRTRLAPTEPPPTVAGRTKRLPMSRIGHRRGAGPQAPRSDQHVEREKKPGGFRVAPLAEGGLQVEPHRGQADEAEHQGRPQAALEPVERVGLERNGTAPAAAHRRRPRARSCRRAVRARRTDPPRRSSPKRPWRTCPCTAARWPGCRSWATGP